MSRADEAPSPAYRAKRTSWAMCILCTGAVWPRVGAAAPRAVAGARVRGRCCGARLFGGIVGLGAEGRRIARGARRRGGRKQALCWRAAAGEGRRTRSATTRLGLRSRAGDRVYSRAAAAAAAGGGLRCRERRGRLEAIIQAGGVRWCSQVLLVTGRLRANLQRGRTEHAQSGRGRADEGGGGSGGGGGRVVRRRGEEEGSALGRQASGTAVVRGAVADAPGAGRTERWAVGTTHGCR